jgi:hypothetical protein
VQNLVRGFATYQDRNSGRWFQVVDKSSLSDNWAETSCSAMYTYTVDAAVKRGYVDAATYQSTVDAGRRGELNRISLHSDGLTYLTTISIGTNVGDYSYYVNWTQATNDFHGLGAFLLFYEETFGVRRHHRVVRRQRQAVQGRVHALPGRTSSPTAAASRAAPRLPAIGQGAPRQSRATKTRRRVGALGRATSPKPLTPTRTIVYRFEMTWLVPVMSLVSSMTKPLTEVSAYTPVTVSVPPVVGTCRTNSLRPVVWVAPQPPSSWLLTPNRPVPVTCCPPMVPVQSAVPVSPWLVPATSRACRTHRPGFRPWPR